MGHQTRAVSLALALVGTIDRRTGKPITAYTAAKRKKIALSTIYRALARRTKAP